MLFRSDNTLRFSLPKRHTSLLGEKIEKRVESLAKAFGKKPDVTVE